MLIFWTFLFIKESCQKVWWFPQKYYATILNIDYDEKYFLNTKISILEWFLKDYVTVEDWSNDAENSAFAITGIKYILKYIQIENGYYCFQHIFDQINADFIFYFQNFKKSHW